MAEQVRAELDRGLFSRVDDGYAGEYRFYLLADERIVRAAEHERFDIFETREFRDERGTDFFAFGDSRFDEGDELGSGDFVDRNRIVQNVHPFFVRANSDRAFGSENAHVAIPGFHDFFGSRNRHPEDFSPREPHLLQVPDGMYGRRIAGEHDDFGSFVEKLGYALFGEIDDFLVLLVSVRAIRPVAEIRVVVRGMTLAELFQNGKSADAGIEKSNHGRSIRQGGSRAKENRPGKRAVFFGLFDHDVDAVALSVVPAFLACRGRHMGRTSDSASPKEVGEHGNLHLRMTTCRIAPKPREVSDVRSRPVYGGVVSESVSGVDGFSAPHVHDGIRVRVDGFYVVSRGVFDIDVARHVGERLDFRNVEVLVAPEGDGGRSGNGIRVVQRRIDDRPTASARVHVAIRGERRYGARSVGIDGVRPVWARSVGVFNGKARIRYAGPAQGSVSGRRARQSARGFRSAGRYRAVRAGEGLEIRLVPAGDRNGRGSPGERIAVIERREGIRMPVDRLRRNRAVRCRRTRRGARGSVSAVQGRTRPRNRTARRRESGRNRRSRSCRTERVGTEGRR